MKAIEILKEFQNVVKVYLNDYEEDEQEDEDYLSASLTAIKIDEAIAELKALENRSCENCVNAYYQQLTTDLDDHIYSCDEYESSFININDSGRPKDFSCDRWKQR